MRICDISFNKHWYTKLVKKYFFKSVFKRIDVISKAFKRNAFRKKKAFWNYLYVFLIIQMIYMLFTGGPGGKPVCNLHLHQTVMKTYLFNLLFLHSTGIVTWVLLRIVDRKIPNSVKKLHLNSLWFVIYIDNNKCFLIV